MRHRIVGNYIGFGTTEKCVLPNSWSDNEDLNKVVNQVLNDALGLTPIQEYGGLDYFVEQNKEKTFDLRFGFEPTYQYEPLYIVCMTDIKQNCFLMKGKAEGAYGSKIKYDDVVTYKDFDKELKDFIDKWHKRLIDAVM